MVETIEFPCKECDAKIAVKEKHVDRSEDDVIEVVCSECFTKRVYSLVRMDAVEEKC